MKIVETVVTIVDLDRLDEIIKEHACPEEMNRIKKWRERVEKEGTLFLRKRVRMTEKEYTSVYFNRFCTFVEMAVTRKDLSCDKNP